jgi:hypothetical protein
MGIHTVLLLDDKPDWAWAAGPGRSPWYGSLDLIRKGDLATLEARLIS